MHTSTLHEPTLRPTTQQDLVDSNTNGVLNLLEAAATAQSQSLVLTNSTSALGRVLTHPAGLRRRQLKGNEFLCVVRLSVSPAESAPRGCRQGRQPCR